MQFVYPHARTHAHTRGTGTRRGRATGQCRGAGGFAWQIERAQSMATLLGVRVERGGKGQVGRCPIIQRGLFGARTSALGGHHRLFSRVTLLLDGLGRGGGSRRRLSADASAPLRCGSLWFASVSSRRTIKYNFLGRGAWCLPATSSGVPRTGVFVVPRFREFVRCFWTISRMLEEDELNDYSVAGYQLEAGSLLGNV